MLWRKTGGASGSHAWDIAYARFNGANTNFFSVAAQDGTPTAVSFKDDGTKMYIVGQANDSVYEYNLSTAWDISTASFVQLLSVAAQEASPSGIAFKPDGTKMYITGSSGDEVNEYTLSTAWDISTASFIQLFSVAGQETTPSGVAFKPDGTKMYIIGTTGDDINEYNLGTAWDISTASFVQLFSVAGQEATPSDLFFKSDGTKMYITGTTGDAVSEYTLSTAWNVSTATFIQTLSVLTQETAPQGLFFKDDGTKMYITGTTAGLVHSYNLSTAWNISTATFTYPTTDYLSVAAQETVPTGVSFKPDGTKMYVIGSNGDEINEYSLSTAWAISTASFVQLFSVAAQEITPSDLFLKPDGTKLYIIGSTGDDVNEYTLSTAWDISTAVFVQLLSVVTQDTSPQGLFFKDDGTRMYIVGTSADRVYQYNLSTAWDISTATTTVPTFSVATQETVPNGVFFKPDGTKMYIVGATGDDVNEYNLTLAWSVGSAVFSQLFSIAGQETLPTDLFFRDDGLKMYIVGNGGTPEVNEYTLSTAWNISTASFIRAFSVNAQETSPQGISFKPDGTKMYILGATGDDVNEYNLSTAWNISTAVFSQLFSVAAQEAIPNGMFFKPDGTKMYIVGQAGLDINEYSLSTAWDVSTASFVSLKLIVPAATTPSGIYISDNGEDLVIVDSGTQNVTQFRLTTPWSLASLENNATDSFSVNAQDISPQSLFFKDDGTKMYVVGGAGIDVNEYNLSVAWDVLTAAFGQVFSVSAQDIIPTGVFFKSDGTKMYIAGANSDAIWAFDL